MANAWGVSWGTSWGVSWGSGGPLPPPPQITDFHDGYSKEEAERARSEEHDRRKRARHEREAVREAIVRAANRQPAQIAPPAPTVVVATPFKAPKFEPTDETIQCELFLMGMRRSLTEVSQLLSQLEADRLEEEIIVALLA